MLKLRARWTQIVCFVPQFVLFERILIWRCIVGEGDSVCPARPMKNKENTLLEIKKNPEWDSSKFNGGRYKI